MKNIFSQCHSLLGKDFRFLKLFFILIASCLIIDLFYTFVVLRPTFTSNERRVMNVEDFPDIILCPEPSVDPFAVESRGYGEQFDYFLGWNGTDLKQIGWAGNNKSEDTKMVSQSISVLKSEKQCPSGNGSYIYFGAQTDKLEWEAVKFSLTKALTPYHKCCKVVRPNSTYSVNQIEFAWPAFKDDGNPTIFLKVFLSDHLTASYFDLHKTTMLGDKIDSNRATGFTEVAGIKNYKVKIMEDQKLEGDPKYPCVDYKKNGKYAKCLENEMVRQNLKFINCTPPWMTDNEDLWCRREYEAHTVITGLKFLNFLKDISVSEQSPGNCLMPCKSKRFLVKEIGIRGNNKNSTGISINFEKEVEITKSSWKIDTQTLISKIGGFIGISKNFLWLIILFITSVGMLMSHLKVNELK